MVSMNDLPPDIQARRVIEDRAAKLGVSRKSYEAAVNRNTAEIKVLLRDAEGSGVAYDQLAALLGVSRQSIFNWRHEISEQPPGGDRSAASK
jgi:hypothetical protein